MIKRFSTALIAMFVFTLAVHAGPREVYQKVHRSVVKIKGVSGGSGSGVIVDHEGWILTNRHVAEGAKRFTIEVEVPSDGPPKVIEYKKVFARVALHKKYDFAIMKIDPNEHPDNKLVVAEVFQGKLYPGEACHIIGHPRGQTKTITSGTISTPYYVDDQDPQKLSHIQTDAVVQGGNSGGPILDDKGRVIGLATFFTTDRRGGSALTGCVPARIFSDELVAWKAQKPDKKKAKKYEEAGDKLLESLDKFLQGGGAGSPQVKYYEQRIGQTYSYALRFDPNNADLLMKIGRMYFRLGGYDKAPQYLVRAIDADPWKYPNAYGYLGMSLIANDEEDKGKAALIEGLSKAPTKADYCWSGMGQYYEKKKKYDEAIYYAKVASDMAKNDPDKEVQRKTYDYYYEIKDKLRDANLDEPTDDDIDAWHSEQLSNYEEKKAQAKAANKQFINEEFAAFIEEQTPKPDPEEKKIQGDGFKVPFNRHGEGSPQIADNDKPDEAVVVVPENNKPVTPDKPKPKPDQPSMADQIAKTIKSKVNLARLYMQTGKKDLAIKELDKLITKYPTAPDIAEVKALKKAWEEQ